MIRCCVGGGLLATDHLAFLSRAEAVLVATTSTVDKASAFAQLTVVAPRGHEGPTSASFNGLIAVARGGWS